VHLLTAFELAFHARGYERLWGSVLDGNRRAVRLYEADHGAGADYRPVGVPQLVTAASSPSATGRSSSCSGG
jgi:hypothetical protein